MDVAQQREADPARLREGLMTERAVTTDREDPGVALAELAGDLAQAAKLGTSDAPEVVAIEDQDDIATPEVAQ